MPRRVQDIVSNDHRSIRDIPVEREKRMSFTPPTSKRKKRRGIKWFVVTLATIVIIALAGFLASTFFSRAVFTIVPKSLEISVNNTYVAYSAPVAGQLGYELVSIHGTASTTVPSSNSTESSAKSQGKITIYNAYSAEAARLIAGTRIANDSGLVYKLTGSVVIPGYTKSGSKIIPGSVSATVIAAEAGQKYDISKNDPISDFKMLGFKGTPRYDSIYARATSDFTGGFIGSKKVVAKDVMASTTELLKSKLTASLLSKIRDSIPEGYVMYDDSYVTSLEPISSTDAGQDLSVISEGMTLYGILVKRADLIRSIGGDKAIASFGNFAYSAPGMDTLDFNIANIKDFDPLKKGTLILHLKGDVKLVGVVPVDELKKKFGGVGLADTFDILKPYSSVINISQSSGELAPPWSKVPTDPDRVTINVANP